MAIPSAAGTRKEKNLTVQRRLAAKHFITVSIVATVVVVVVAAVVVVEMVPG